VNLIVGGGSIAGHRVIERQEKHGIRLIFPKCEVDDVVLTFQIAHKRTSAVMEAVNCCSLNVQPPNIQNGLCPLGRSSKSDIKAFVCCKTLRERK